YAHDEAGEARVGDTVRIISTRPLSKLKRWRLKEIVSRSTRVA
ncbi:MAG: 30S ribosomal protein S17, partial [Candidatus Acidiferrales bacterium]